MAAKVYGIIGTNKAMKEVIPKDNIRVLTGTVKNVEGRGARSVLITDEDISGKKDRCLKEYCVIAIEVKEEGNNGAWYPQRYMNELEGIYPMVADISDDSILAWINNLSFNTHDMRYRITLLKVE